jgi:hypothetical protein
MTGLQEIVSKRLGEDVRTYIQRQHTEITYTKIARMITQATGIRLSVGTVSMWAREVRR